MSLLNTIYEATGIAYVMDMFHFDKNRQENNPGNNQKYIPDQVTPIKYSFRPKTFEEYIGQINAKERAKLTIQKILSGKMTHILVSGVKGTGKTTLANIIANELNAKMSYYIGGSFNKEKNLKEFLINNEKDKNHLHILFIDEIHNIPKETGEYLYPILEDFKLPEGEDINLKPFCFIGCTTEMETLMGKLSPMVDRCGGEPINLEPYTYEDIKQIMKQYNRQIYKTIIPEEVFDILCRNARYTPRIALAIIDDYIACNDVEKVLKIRRIIKDGLTDVDLRILRHLNEINKPVGEQVLAVISNVTTTYYRQLIEPFLLMEGYITRTARGRLLTDKAKKLLEEIK